MRNDVLTLTKEECRKVNVIKMNEVCVIYEDDEVFYVCVPNNK